MAEQVEESAPFGNVKLKVLAYTIPMMLVARCKVESWKRGVLGQHLGMWSFGHGRDHFVQRVQKELPCTVNHKIVSTEINITE